MYFLSYYSLIYSKLTLLCKTAGPALPSVTEEQGEVYFYNCQQDMIVRFVFISPEEALQNDEAQLREELS